MPIRIAVSPRAWMMKGDATWKAPSAAAPLIRVRRLNFGLKACVIMNYPPDRCVSCFKFYRHGEERSDKAIHTSFVTLDCIASLAMTVSSFRAARCVRHQE